MLTELGCSLIQRPCNVAALCDVNCNLCCADLPLRRRTAYLAHPGPYPRADTDTHANNACANIDAHANARAVAGDANIDACRAGRADPNALVQSQVPVNTTRVQRCDRRTAD